MCTCLLDASFFYIFFSVNVTLLNSCTVYVVQYTLLILYGNKKKITRDCDVTSCLACNV